MAPTVFCGLYDEVSRRAGAQQAQAAADVTRIAQEGQQSTDAFGETAAAGRWSHQEHMRSSLRLTLPRLSVGAFG
jgi:hypothetical protein